MANDPKDLGNSLYFCHFVDKNNFSIESFVRGYFVLLTPVSGRATISLNGQMFEADSRCILLMHPHVGSQLVSISDDFKAYVIGTVMELQSSVTYNIPPAFLALILRDPLWLLDEETCKAVHAFCVLFDYNCNQMKGTCATTIAAALLSAFVQGFYEKTKHMIPSDNSPGVTLVTRSLIARFMNELRLHYTHSHQVAYYADRLCVSSKYLTQVIKRSMGLTPKELIDRKLAIESMYLLGKNDMTIQEVSNALGFPDQSYFGRFFKRLLGISPLAYRKNPDLSLMSRLKSVEASKMLAPKKL